MNKPCVKDMDMSAALLMFEKIGEKSFRARQLFNWLYERNVSSFDEMSNYSKELRAALDSMYTVSPLLQEERLVSAFDGTEKYLLKTLDGHFIESVLIKNDGTDEGRLTVCLSSQIGCLMGCSFCETAKIKFIRNLSAGEILDQLCHIRRISGLRNNNIVFMGMGEPFLNYDNVIKAADIMNYTFGFHISLRKITISTCGIRPGIERFINEKKPYNLAISLNDTLPEKRRRNMPVEKKYPFSEIADIINAKFRPGHNWLTLEYVMRKDNISPEDALRLKKMLKIRHLKINLISLNPGKSGLEAPGEKEMEAFINELVSMNIPVSVRKSLGSDICGACGQLSGRKSSL